MSAVLQETRNYCKLLSKYISSFLVIMLSNFSQALYIGQYQHGLYAFPSLVDELTTLVAPHSTPLLIEGPDGSSSDSSAQPVGNNPGGLISINMRLPTDIKVRPDQSHGASINSHVPALTLIGKSVKYG